MGPGHLGVGLAAKLVAPKAPLGGLLVASEALDLLCFGFIALGLEKVAASQTSLVRGVMISGPGSLPWSHGLFMAVAWGLGVSGLAQFVFRNRRTSAVMGLVVSSHWLLDFIVHLPDLPLFLAGSPVVGLGLWGTGPGLVLSGVLEIGLLVGGLAVYLRTRRKLK